MVINPRRTAEGNINMHKKYFYFENKQKKFPGVHALKGVSFSVEKGEVHALLGENGAGKSTLLNILHGVFTASEGDVYIEEEKVNFTTPVEALEYGIAKVHQEIHMVDCLSVGGLQMSIQFCGSAESALHTGRSCHGCAGTVREWFSGYQLCFT